MAEVIHIQSLENPLVKHLAKLRTDARYRKEQNKVLLVGKTLLREYTAQNQLSTLIIAEESNKIDMPAARTVLVKMNILKKITGLENPEGYAAEIELPKASSLKECRSILAMDAVSDPGNMGTLFRSALAFGWEGVFLLPGCCDPFNDKALRAGRGAQLSMAYRFGTEEELKALCNDNGMTPMAADIQGTPIDSLSPPAKPLLVLGNEGQGIQPSLLSWCSPLTIPMAPHMESLNVSVAGSLLMYIIKRTSM